MLREVAEGRTAFDARGTMAMAMATVERSESDLKLVVDAARAAVEQEFRIAERLDAKARNQLTVAGTWYALVTAFAGVAVRTWIDRGMNDLLVAAVIVFAGAAGVCLIVALVYSYRVWRLRSEPDIKPDGLLKMLDEAHDPEVDVAEQLVLHYRALLARRRVSNKVRVDSFKASVLWWMFALGFSLAELIASLAALAQA